MKREDNLNRIAILSGGKKKKRTKRKSNKRSSTRKKQKKRSVTKKKNKKKTRKQKQTKISRKKKTKQNKTKQLKSGTRDGFRGRKKKKNSFIAHLREDLEEIQQITDPKEKEKKTLEKIRERERKEEQEKENRKQAREQARKRREHEKKFKEYLKNKRGSTEDKLTPEERDERDKCRIIGQWAHEPENFLERDRKELSKMKEKDLNKEARKVGVGEEELKRLYDDVMKSREKVTIDNVRDTIINIILDEQEDLRREEEIKKENEKIEEYNKKCPEHSEGDYSKKKTESDPDPKNKSSIRRSKKFKIN